MDYIEQEVYRYRAEIRSILAEAAAFIAEEERDACANLNRDNETYHAQVAVTASHTNHHFYDEGVANASSDLESYGMALQADSGQSVPAAATASGGMHDGTCQCEECAQAGVVSNDMSVQDYEYEYATSQAPNANESYEGPRF